MTNIHHFLGEEVEGLGFPCCGALREKAHTGGREGSASQPPVWLGALLATLGVPGTLALCSPAPRFVGYKPASRGGAALPGPTPALTLGTAHCLHWAQGDGWARSALLPARRLRGPSSWGKSPRAVSWGIQGLARGGRMWKPPASLFPSPAVDQTGRTIQRVGPSGPEVGLFQLHSPRPGGLPSHCMWSSSSVPRNKCHEALNGIDQTNRVYGSGREGC